MCYNTEWNNGHNIQTVICVWEPSVVNVPGHQACNVNIMDSAKLFCDLVVLLFLYQVETDPNCTGWKLNEIAKLFEIDYRI